MTVYSDDEFFVWAVNTLAYSDEGRFHLKVYKNGSIFWRGIILTDRFEWQDTGEPVSITIRAICGIGRLRNIKIDTTDVISTGVNLTRQIQKLLQIAGGTTDLYDTGDRFLTTSMFWLPCGERTTVESTSTMLAGRSYSKSPATKGNVCS